MSRLLHILIIVIFSILGLYLTLSLPFYYSWDMDLLTFRDILQLKDNQMPAHVNHPGLGMYWLHLNLIRLAEIFGFITPLKSETLFASIDPMLLVAEHSYFMRVVNSLSCISLVVVLWASFKKLYETNVFLNTLVLLIFITLPGLWLYDFLMIRTEIYSLLFWALSLFFILRASDDNKVGWNTVLAGFFAGLSFFTKIQVFFLLPLLVFIYIYKQKNSIKENKYFAYRYWLVLAIFVSFFIGSIFATLPSYKADFADRYWVNKFFFAFIGVLFVIKYLQRSERFGGLTQFLNVFILSSLIVVFLPLLSPMSLNSGLHYGFLNFKVLFSRILESHIGQFNILDNLILIWQNNWLYLIITFFLISYLIYKKNRPVVMSLILVTLLAQHVVGVRSNLQDSLWIQIPFIVVALIVIRDLKNYYASAVLSTLLIFNIYNTTQFKKFQLPPQIAYFDSLIYYIGTFVDNERVRRFSSIYPSVESRAHSISLASRVFEIKRHLFLNFSKTSADLTDVGGSANAWFISLRKHSDSNLEIYYRPDLTQKIYFPLGFDLSLVQFNNCDKFEAPVVTISNEKFHGFIFRGTLGKGKETPMFCTIQTKSFANSFVMIEHFPQASFQGY